MIVVRHIILTTILFEKVYNKTIETQIIKIISNMHTKNINDNAENY